MVKALGAWQWVEMLLADATRGSDACAWGQADNYKRHHLVDHRRVCGGWALAHSWHCDKPRHFKVNCPELKTNATEAKNKPVVF
jgi:hypothetical protein